MVVQHFPGKVVRRIEHDAGPVWPQPGGNKDIEVAHDRRKPLEVDLVVVLQQEREVLPRREGVAGKIEEGVKRFVTAHLQSVTLQRQPEHPDNAQHACRRQHPQRDPAANNADKQENSEGDDDISPCAAHNHVSQQAKGDGAHEEEDPAPAILAQKIDHQHGRNKEVEEALKRHAGDFTREDLAVGVQPEQQKAVVHKEDGDAH